MANRPKSIRIALAVCAVAIAAATLTLLLPFAGASLIRAWFDALPAGEQKTVDTALRVLSPAVSSLALALSVLIHRRRARNSEDSLHD
ncbi:hypothetical protein [Niveibacterium terrae]|uniref:hypothetical protein n=1 Tax=Niveibacterium terrae TaxID=3373598 RepID=UPI003A903E40